MELVDQLKTTEGVNRFIVRFATVTILAMARSEFIRHTREVIIMRGESPAPEALIKQSIEAAHMLVSRYEEVVGPTTWSVIWQEVEGDLREGGGLIINHLMAIIASGSSAGN